MRTLVLYNNSIFKIEETISFAKLVESTGILALGVHGR